MDAAAVSSCSFPIHHHLHPSKRSSSRCQNPIFLANFTSSIAAHAPSNLLSADPLRSFPSFPLSSSSSWRRQRSNPSFTTHGPRRGKPISAVFERFTERAIKAVVFSQREALALGRRTVHPHHLLLGLIAEDRSPDGFLGSGITLAQARQLVASFWKKDKDITPAADSSAAAPTSATDIPFSVSTKLVFEAAVEYSRNMGYNFIGPEHLVIALFAVEEGSVRIAIEKYCFEHSWINQCFGSL